MYILEDSKSDFYVFVLGDDSISASNKPLEPGITYTLKVRGFTLNGYRDSPTVRFEMPGKRLYSIHIFRIT